MSWNTPWKKLMYPGKGSFHRVAKPIMRDIHFIKNLVDCQYICPKSDQCICQYNSKMSEEISVKAVPALWLPCRAAWRSRLYRLSAGCCWTGGTQTWTRLDGHTFNLMLKEISQKVLKTCFFFYPNWSQIQAISKLC